MGSDSVVSLRTGRGADFAYRDERLANARQTIRMGDSLWNPKNLSNEYLKYPKIGDKPFGADLWLDAGLQLG